MDEAFCSNCGPLDSEGHLSDCPRYAPNDTRADHGTRIVETYRVAYDQGEPDADVLVDILTDLMHWADRAGVDWDAVLYNADDNHALEQGLTPAECGNGPMSGYGA